MYSLKKKMAALLPSESARGALQNMLEVEWSGHKTVLVKVPDSGASRTNEVEMTESSSGGGYGRLMDDDEDDRAFLNQSRSYFDQPRRQVEYETDRPPAPPPKPAYDSRTSSYNSYNAPPERESNMYGNSSSRTSANPFRSVDDGDYSPASSIIENRPQISTSRRLDTDLFSFEQQHGERGCNTAPNAAAKANPWAGRNWGNGNGEGQTSPTSSMGTRYSPSPSAEDPFKN